MRGPEQLIRGLEKMLVGVQVVAILCNQFGDSGKGKFSDLFAEYWADVIVRGTGGDNAGHTVKFGNVKRVYHLLPAGIGHDKVGKINVMGNGMAINPLKLVAELDDNVKNGGTYNHLMVSRDAIVIMPYHKIFDKYKFQSLKNGGVGSTGSGITPVYTDKIARRPIFMIDLLDKDRLIRKIEDEKPLYEWQINREITRVNGEIKEHLLKHPEDKDKEEFHEIPVYKINVDEIVQSFNPAIERIKPLIRDSVNEMAKFYRGGKNILMEGAQGLFLSVEHGVDPYITSSNCSLDGTATGSGLSAGLVDLPLGIVKFPFMTRVGGGPFVTEFGGSRSEEYCSESKGNQLRDELLKYNIPFETEGKKTIYDGNHPIILEMTRSKDPFIQSIGYRMLAFEFGATTGRPRRLGATDAVLGKYATTKNGINLVFTKVDCFAGADEYNICEGYQDTDGSIHTDYRRDLDFLRRVKPVYRSFKGYGHDVKNVRNYEDFDPNLREGMDFFANFSSGRIRIVSNGEDRDQTVILN